MRVARYADPAPSPLSLAICVEPGPPAGLDDQVRRRVLDEVEHRTTHERRCRLTPCRSAIASSVRTWGTLSAIVRKILPRVSLACCTASASQQADMRTDEIRRSVRSGGSSTRCGSRQAVLSGSNARVRGGPLPRVGRARSCARVTFLGACRSCVAGEDELALADELPPSKVSPASSCGRHDRCRSGAERDGRRSRPRDIAPHQPWRAVRGADESGSRKRMPGKRADEHRGDIEGSRDSGQRDVLQALLLRASAFWEPNVALNRPSHATGAARTTSTGRSVARTSQTPSGA